jgi:hypothetical protein
MKLTRPSTKPWTGTELDEEHLSQSLPHSKNLPRSSTVGTLHVSRLPNHL